MRYWFVHIILVGLLVAIWVPTLAQPKYQEQASASIPEYYEREMESIPVDTNRVAYMPPTPPPSESELMEEPVGTSAASQGPSIITTIIDHMKELGSLAIMLGNVMTFFWQWKDRRKTRDRVS